MPSTNLFALRQAVFEIEPIFIYATLKWPWTVKCDFGSIDALYVYTYRYRYHKKSSNKKGACLILSHDGKSMPRWPKICRTVLRSPPICPNTEDRNCQYCLNMCKVVILEDEYHFLCSCPLYSDLRKQLLPEYLNTNTSHDTFIEYIWQQIIR